MATPVERSALPSKLLPVVQLADEIITVGDLVAGQDLFTVTADAPTTEVAHEMRRHDFRWAPVTAVPMTHYVRTGDLEGRTGTVADAALPIPPERRIPDTAKLTALIDHLLDDDVAFVTHRDLVFGILTSSDIQHAAVGLYTFGLVTALESGLDQLVVRYTDNDWQGRLSKNRLAKAQQVRAERLAADVDVGLQACLMLEDRLTLARKVDEVVDVLGFESKGGGFDPWAKRLKSVRDCLAHGNNILDAVPDVNAACSFLHDLRGKTARVWSQVSDDEQAPSLEARSMIELEVAPGKWVSTDGQDLFDQDSRTTGPVHVISAHNPGRIRQGPSENLRAHERLVARVTDRELDYVNARAGMGEYWEEGVGLVDAGRSRACALAASFGQSTIFEVHPDSILVVDSKTNEVVGRRALSG